MSVHVIVQISALTQDEYIKTNKARQTNVFPVHEYTYQNGDGRKIQKCSNLIQQILRLRQTIVCTI